ncbi:BrxA/BrxB family bacilliredoxin [Bacillus velezensis]|nr:BrxA/BrxB family bacilliredoxin [Bacillus velezensis]
MAYEEYMRQLVVPMRRELTGAGFQELTTAEEVESFMEQAEGTTLVVVNSVCGCAAGLARPVATQAVLQHEKAPDHTVTVFAGQDKDATAKCVNTLRAGTFLAINGAVKRKEVVHFIPATKSKGMTWRKL